MTREWTDHRQPWPPPRASCALAGRSVPAVLGDVGGAKYSSGVHSLWGIPRSRTSTRSARRIWLGRWLTMTAVICPLSERSCSINASSLSLSRPDAGSSISNIGERRTKARAIQIPRMRPLGRRRVLASPTTVSKPRGSDSIMRRMPVLKHARRKSSSVAIGSFMRRFCAIVPRNRLGFCGTYATRRRRSLTSNWRLSTPSMYTRPDWMGYRPLTSLRRVDLPEPETPVTQTKQPRGKDTSMAHRLLATGLQWAMNLMLQKPYWKIKRVLWVWRSMKINRKN